MKEEDGMRPLRMISTGTAYMLFGQELSTIKSLLNALEIASGKTCEDILSQYKTGELEKTHENVVLASTLHIYLTRKKSLEEILGGEEGGVGDAKST